MRMITTLSVLATAWLLCTGPAVAQNNDYSFDRGYPTADTTRRTRDDADFQRAMVAYRFWYPTVSVEGIFNGNREAGLEDGKALGIAAAGPRQIGFTLNSDTPTAPA